jgi:hypothetical protein
MFSRKERRGENLDRSGRRTSGEWRKLDSEELHDFYFRQILMSVRGTGSAVCIATGYGFDGPGIESRWGRDFPHLSKPALGPTQSPVQ